MIHENNIIKKSKCAFKNLEKNNIIYLKNDVICASINTIGGNIEEVSLLKYKKKINSNKPFKLLKKNSNFIYQANSKIIGNDGPDSSIHCKEKPIYKIDKKNFYLKNLNKKTIYIPLIWKSKNNSLYIKTFILNKGDYRIKIEYDIYNYNKNIHVSTLHKLQQNINIPNANFNYNSIFSKNTYRGSAYSSDIHKFKKESFEDIKSNDAKKIHTKKGWIAMIQQYFCTAWIPGNTENNIFFRKNIKKNQVSINCQSNLISINKNFCHKISSSLWVGPEIQKEMKNIAPYLDFTVDYGYLWFFSKPLFKLLNFFFKIVNNWGWAIVLTTLTIRAIMYPLTKIQYISSEKFRLLQPEIERIKQKYKNNKKKLNEKIISLYNAEQINPIKSFIPTLLQMPLFLSLYTMLVASVELRHAGFILWINDLSSKDPYFVLPIFMGLTMFYIQQISKTNNSNSIQPKYMLFVPIILTCFFLCFPSGLVLYYTVNNLITIVQNKFIFNKINK
ncbi:membrane protein insertase YidC [Buchnera aphidicola]|uniref:membrane protein insertase YidC n=1 Tax=Buchnera aphidicola TaxID=9 RepID=UPI0034646569